MADPAAAATNAATNAAKSAVSGLSSIASQAFHPKNWIRNAGIIALAAVFLPAAAAAATPAGFSMATFVTTAKTTALSGIGAATQALPGAVKAAAGGVGDLVHHAQALVPAQ